MPKFSLPLIDKCYEGEWFFDNAGLQAVVKRPCENKHDGRWFCVTHLEPFENQLQKDIHIEHGSHKLAWFCSEHGFEQP